MFFKQHRKNCWIWIFIRDPCVFAVVVSRMTSVLYLFLLFFLSLCTIHYALIIYRILRKNFYSNSFYCVSRKENRHFSRERHWFFTIFKNFIMMVMMMMMSNCQATSSWYSAISGGIIRLSGNWWRWTDNWGRCHTLLQLLLIIRVTESWI